MYMALAENPLEADARDSAQRLGYDQPSDRASPYGSDFIRTIRVRWQGGPGLKLAHRVFEDACGREPRGENAQFARCPLYFRLSWRSRGFAPDCQSFRPFGPEDLNHSSQVTRKKDSVISG